MTIPNQKILLLITNISWHRNFSLHADNLFPVLLKSSSEDSRGAFRLYYNNKEIHVRSYTSIIRYLSHERMTKIVTNKDDIYYVGHGVIFDVDYNLLFRIGESNVTASFEVYKHKDKLVCSGIVKGIIDFYANQNIHVIIRNTREDVIAPALETNVEFINAYLSDNAPLIVDCL